MTEPGLPPIAFLGAGQMAEAFVRGLLRAELLAPTDVWVSDVRPGRAEQLARDFGVNPATSNLGAVEHADLIRLSVKPQDVPGLLDGIGADVRADHLVISIAAGVTLNTLDRRLPHHPPVIRVMPNTPALVQTGMAVLAPGDACDGRTYGDCAPVVRRPRACNRAAERHLDAVTALSDSMLGTGRMLTETGIHPALLKEAVSSPGGTSIAGLHALERGGIRAVIMDAIVAATERSTELGQSAGG